MLLANIASYPNADADPGGTGIVGEFATVVGGAASVSLIRSRHLEGVGLMRIDGICTVAGVGGTFKLTSLFRQGNTGVLVTLAGFDVGVAVVGDEFHIEYPVALKGTVEIFIESTAGAGTWNVSPNGFTGS